jgi:hypothetical protein
MHPEASILDKVNANFVQKVQWGGPQPSGYLQQMLQLSQR